MHTRVLKFVYTTPKGFGCICGHHQGC